MKKTIPMKIERNLFEMAKVYRKADHVTLPAVIQWYIEQNQLVEIPTERIVTKKHKIKDFKEAFQFKYTSLQLEERQIDMLLSLYPSVALNRIVEAILFDYVKRRDPEWDTPYFDDNFFFNTYGYREDEFISAYNRLIKEFPHLTQRDYEKNRQADEPTLYALRKKYGSYTKFKLIMAEIP